VTIEAASVDTGHEKRDEHLRNPDFSTRPNTRRSHSFQKKVIKGDSGKLKIVGDLTLHGVTREITVDLEGPTPEIKDPGGNFRRGATGSARIRPERLRHHLEQGARLGWPRCGKRSDDLREIEWVRK